MRDAARLEAEATALMPAEDTVAVSVGEVVPAASDQSTQGIQLKDTLNNPDQVARDASAERTGMLWKENLDITAPALDMATTIGAENSAEKALAHQLALAHKAVFEMADKSLSLMHKIDSYTNPRAMQIYSVESVRLMNASARMMKAFQDGMIALHKIRTGGQQTMTVQHVSVSDGGQAVIGHVSTVSGEGEKE